MKIKNSFKKRMAALALLMSVVVSATACGGGGSSEGGQSTSGSTSVDTSGKLILNVATYDGGIGTEWIKQSKADFEALYANTKFGDKTGVYVNTVGNKQMGGDTIENDSLKYDVYFTEMVSYYSFVNKGKFAEISDIVTGAYPADFGVDASEGTIESKLSESWKDYLTSKDGKYYALPFYDGIYGIFYDVDLFENNNWYFNTAGVFGGSGAKSAGLDGVEGTDDDGLPETYEQFNIMLEGIVSAGVVPFSYADQKYVGRMLANLWSNYEGLDQMLLNNTFSGTADNIVTSFSNDKPVVESVNIDGTNGYLLQKQAGKYYALNFMEDVMFGSDENYNGSIVNGLNYRTAQSNFVMNKYKNGSTVYAMHVDGVWWEHEATSDFVTVEAHNPGQTKATRKFGFMPIPKATADQSYDKQTVISQNDSYCFINANSENLEVAKLFLQFVHTNKQLANFTIGTSVTRSLNYTMDEDDLAQCSYYGQRIYNLKKSADIYYPVSSVNFVINNIGYFDFEQSWCWMSKNGSKQSTEVLSRFASGETAQQYFNGLSAYFNKDSWKGN